MASPAGATCWTPPEGAYDYGVHCDVCHKVESVVPAAPAGVAGRLKILRPFEISPSPTLGEWLPLTFGPFDDVPNPRMGSVARDHFHGAEFCSGCHQLDQAALVPGAAIDRKRWPDGRLPIHSTYEEWRAGPFAPGTPCQSCHMPSDARVLNSSDLQLFLVSQGAAGGWPRPAGTTRRHVWAGPRQPEFRMLRLAAALSVDRSVAGNELTVRVKVRNVGCGHALPTGEPMRSMVVRVEASCGGQPLVATGGRLHPRLRAATTGARRRVTIGAPGPARAWGRWCAWCSAAAAGSTIAGSGHSATGGSAPPTRECRWSRWSARPP